MSSALSARSLFVRLSRSCALAASLLIAGYAGAQDSNSETLLASQHASAEPAAAAQAPKVVHIVPIQGAINNTQLFILRRALKEAISNGVDTVILDMDTPGGAMGATMKMMDALQKFPGTTITYINSEAVSAGSYIAVATDQIWFAPNGIIGAAEAVSGGGQDIPESMQRKLSSYMRAKVRVVSKGNRYRADVQRAMMDPQFELKIGDDVLKKPGELLSLTAEQAAQTYGEPPEPLLSSGTADNIEALLDSALGKGSYTVRDYKLTWSESFALWFETLTPLLLSLGVLLLFIEFKTPGFGIMGMIGIGCLLLVFAGSYAAGLAGHEALLVFLLGVILLLVELLLIPGTLVAASIGIICIVGSLLWAMADIWPKGAENYSLSPSLFFYPMVNLIAALAIAAVAMLLIARFLPKTRIGKGLILEASVGGKDLLLAGGGRSLDRESAELQRESKQHKATAQDAAASGSAPFSTAGTGTTASSTTTANTTNAASTNADQLPPIGARGIAVTPLRPSGEVEINGRRYQARLALGQVERGVIVEVTGHRDFALLVKA